MAWLNPINKTNEPNILCICDYDYKQINQGDATNNKFLVVILVPDFWNSDAKKSDNWKDYVVFSTFLQRPTS